MCFSVCMCLIFYLLLLFSCYIFLFLLRLHVHFSFFLFFFLLILCLLLFERLSVCVHIITKEKDQRIITVATTTTFDIDKENNRKEIIPKAKNSVNIRHVQTNWFLLVRGAFFCIEKFFVFC